MPSPSPQHGHPPAQRHRALQSWSQRRCLRTKRQPTATPAANPRENRHSRLPHRTRTLTTRRAPIPRPRLVRAIQRTSPARAAWRARQRAPRLPGGKLRRAVRSSAARRRRLAAWRRPRLRRHKAKSHSNRKQESRSTPRSPRPRRERMERAQQQRRRRRSREFGRLVAVRTRLSARSWLPPSAKVCTRACNVYRYACMYAQRCILLQLSAKVRSRAQRSSLPRFPSHGPVPCRTCGVVCSAVELEHGLQPAQGDPAEEPFRQ